MTQAKKKARESNPKLKALGWDELEPDALIDRTLDLLKKKADEAKRLAQCQPDEGEPAAH